MTDMRLHSPKSEQAIANAHPCPVIPCDLLVAAGNVACPAHWCMVPKADRWPLVHAFRRRTVDPIAYGIAVARARELVLEYAR